MAANDVMKPATLLRTLMKSCEYTYHSKYSMGFSTLSHLTVSNLIHAGIPLLLFYIVLISRCCKHASEIVQTVFYRPAIRLISSIHISETNSMTPRFYSFRRTHFV